MGLSTAQLRLLLAKGIDHDTIVELSAVADTEADAAREEQLAKRRESNRRRQKAWYDRNIRNNDDNGVSSCDNQDNPVRKREDVRSNEQKNVLEPIKNPSGITSSSTPSGSQVPSSAKARKFDWPRDYREQFWDRYLRRTDKKKAFAALDRLYRADRVAFAVVMAGVGRMADSGLAAEFAPHPTTFINNDRWEDEWPKRNGAAHGPAPPRRNGSADLWAADAFTANDERQRGPDDGLPFDSSRDRTEGARDQGRHRAGPGTHGGGDRLSPQQPGDDPRQLPPLRLVGGQRAHG